MHQPLYDLLFRRGPYLFMQDSSDDMPLIRFCVVFVEEVF